MSDGEMENELWGGKGTENEEKHCSSSEEILKRFLERKSK